MRYADSVISRVEWEWLDTITWKDVSGNNYGVFYVECVSENLEGIHGYMVASKEYGQDISEFRCIAMFDNINEALGFFEQQCKWGYKWWIPE